MQDYTAEPNDTILIPNLNPLYISILITIIQYTIMHYIIH